MKGRHPYVAVFGTGGCLMQHSSIAEISYRSSLAFCTTIVLNNHKKELSAI